jgi:pyridoxamine 5'-phosphate oxidase
MIFGQRREYDGDASRLPFRTEHPLQVFARWVDDAAGQLDHNAFTLTTRGMDAMLESRQVLAKEISPEGVRFFTRADSRKAGQIAWDARVAGTWFDPHHSLQVNFSGVATKMDAPETALWWMRRPALARVELLTHVMGQTRKSIIEAMSAMATFGSEHWSGYLIEVRRITFWVGRPHRAHATQTQVDTPEEGWTIV